MAVATTTPAARAAGESAPAPEAASAAALTWVTVGSGLLVLGIAVHLVTAIQQVSPGWGTYNAATSIGRLRPTATGLIVLGGLGMLGTGVALELARRLSGAPVLGDLVARAAGALTTLAVAVGTLLVLAGHGTGRDGLELPRPAAVPLAIGLTVAAAVVIRQLAARRGDELHPAGWFLASSVLAGPVCLLLGTLPRVAGINDEIVIAFSTSGLLLLWLVGLGLAAAHYVVPRACRAPLHSERLARLGFWGWVAFAPLAGPVRLVGGPGQEWLESIGIAAAIALVVPALAIATNLFATYAGRRSRAHAADLRFALAGTGLLVLWSVLHAIGAGRSASDLLRASVFTEGLRELALFGAAGCLLAAAVLNLLPDLAGSPLANPRVAASLVWLASAGVLLVALALLVAGYAQGAIATAAVRSGGDAYLGQGWDAVADAIRPLLWLRVVGELLVLTAFAGVFQQVFSTMTSGESLDDAPAAG